MGGRHDDEQLVGRDDPPVQALRPPRALDEAQAGLAVAHLSGHLGGVHGVQGDRGLGVLRGQLHQPAGEQVLGHGEAGGDAQPPVAAAAE